MTAAGDYQDLACRRSASSPAGDTSRSGAAISRSLSTTGSAGRARSSSGTASPVCARRTTRCMSNSSMAVNDASISSSAPTGFIPACANSSLVRRSDTRRTLGYRVAAFEAGRYRPRNELVYIIRGAPGRQVGRFALHDDRTLFLFIFDGGGEPEANGVAAQRAILRKAFEGDGWELPRILAALDTCNELYFDRVSQIRMDAWSQGRIALVGDAAFCVSLLAGQGSALAVTAAYVLAGELATSPGRPQAAFRRYEDRLRPFIHAKQRAAERFAAAFVPRTRPGVFFRNQVIKTFRVPAIARIAIGRDIRDQLELPQYHL